MVGVICAMPEEAALLLADTENKKTKTVSGIEFTGGSLCGQDVVIAVCGIGKVFAAMCTQTMILTYHPSLIFNTGVAGNLSDSLRCGDIAIAQYVAQYDVDMTALGDPLGRVAGVNRILFPCDSAVAEKIRTICEERLGINSCCGTVVSGDTFVSDAAKKAFLAGWQNSVACDMESGALGQVCYVNQVPFAVIRAISDDADGNSTVDYATFKIEAAQKAAKVLKNYLQDA